MGGWSHHRLHPSAPGPIHERCSHDRRDVGLQKSLAERPGFRPAHAHLFHKPGRAWSHGDEAPGVGEGKAPACRTPSPKHAAEEESSLGTGQLNMMRWTPD